MEGSVQVELLSMYVSVLQKTLTYFLCQFISLCLLSVSMLFTSFSRNEGTELAAVAAHNAAFYFREWFLEFFASKSKTWKIVSMNKKRTGGVLNDKKVVQPYGMTLHTYL